ncbi:imelysin family protein [Malaciobacter mytili]|uniref:Imelysin n=1 Tax=Malaciobacter mytili LMG 24559 TaxID=1032238 RepID=A0AAX2AK31_9BACT|nr:imelysin family protein [Malaciobacter mytili]AXH14323.1 peptidase, M75 family [Malaciobacter mytili LMG 24559]RXI43400.1 imelysin [Malaciobacter mytili]RXK16545.1 imelysin [Malaciobacter mytili LMG 24559]
MKKIFIILALAFGFSYANTFSNILTNVSLPNVNKAIKNAQDLKSNFKKEDFEKFVISWKKVQALYLAGDINEDYIDTPRYVDIFHHGNEDITKQLNRAIASNEEASLALFKNSNKSINAVEYILYKDETLTKREKELLTVMLDAIISHLNDIKTVYTTYLQGKQKDEKWGNAVIINALIDGTYKLKEWRVGDPAGLSRKYRNNPDNSRGEYYLSKQSFAAIRAILDVHEEVMGEKNFPNFASMAIDGGAKKQVEEVRIALKNSIYELNKLQKEDFSKAQKLFEALSIFHNTYYLSLVEQLSVTAKILDADGD